MQLIVHERHTLGSFTTSSSKVKINILGKDPLSASEGPWLRISIVLVVKVPIG